MKLSTILMVFSAALVAASPIAVPAAQTDDDLTSLMEIKADD